MEKTKISIIVPVYKVEAYLPQCIESLINQTYKNLEIILVDDGSPDNCPAICDEYAKKDSRIKVFHLENGGVSRARNIGIKEATGDYVSFIDSDDYLEVNSYKNIINENQNKYDLIAYNYKLDFDGKLVDSKINLDNNILDKETLYNEILSNRICGYVWNKLYRRELLINNGVKFDETVKIMEDLIFNLECLKYINEGIYVSNAIYFYKQRQGSALNSAYKFNNFKAIKKIVDLLDQVNQKLSVNYKYRFLFEYKKGKILKHDPNMDLEELEKTVNEYKLQKIFYKAKVPFSSKIKFILVTGVPWIYKIKRYN